jgi:valyl-tRNA synthetase
VSISVRCAAEIAADLNQVKPQFEMLAKATLTDAGPAVTQPTKSASFSLADADGYLPLGGLVDLQAEVVRLKKEVEKLRGFIAGSEKKLTNQSFIDRAPPEVVDEVRATLASQQAQLASVEEAVKRLSEP